MICFLRVVVSWFVVCSNSHVTDHLVNVAARKLAQVMVTDDGDTRHKRQYFSAGELAGAAQFMNFSGRKLNCSMNGYSKNILVLLEGTNYLYLFT